MRARREGGRGRPRVGRGGIARLGDGSEWDEWYGRTARRTARCGEVMLPRYPTMNAHLVSTAALPQTTEKHGFQQ